MTFKDAICLFMEYCHLISVSRFNKEGEEWVDIR